MEISVRQTNLKPSSIKTLLATGIVLISHLNTFDVARLAQKTRLPIDECEDILAATKPKRPHYVSKVSQLILKPFERISTLINDLDDVLNGGIRCGHLTEVSGQAGSGKSNLCAEIGTLVMLPEESGGKNGHVLLIHTEGVGKLKLEIKRFNALAASVGHEALVKDRLRVINCASEFELVEIVNRLPEILEEQTSVKLIIIDSITCAFISIDQDPDFKFYAKRGLSLTRIVKILAQVAWDRRVAIIATNHVSYDPKLGETKPALGKAWSHMCHTKIYLDRTQASRYAQVTKGATKFARKVPFQITNSLFD